MHVVHVSKICEYIPIDIQVQTLIQQQKAWYILADISNLDNTKNSKHVLEVEREYGRGY